MNTDSSKNFYRDISAEFRDKYCKSFKGDILQDEVTQPFWYSMHLEQKRMKNLGIQKRMQIKRNQDTGEPGLSEDEIQTTYTAGNRLTLIHTPVSVRKTYTLNGNRKKRITDYCQCAQCVVIESDRAVDEHICPFCGNIGNSESFIDGCDYCGAKFRVTNLGRKISSYNVFHDYETDIKDKKKLYKILAFIAAMISVLLYFISFASFGRSDILATEAMLQQISKVVGGIGIGIFIAVVYAQWRLRNTYTERVVSNDELRKVEDSIKNFNKEEFAASLDYKMKTLHFTENHENYSGLYENVLECNLKNCCITEFTSDEKDYHLKTEVILDLLCLEKNKLVTRQEKMFVSLYKNRVEKTSPSIVSYSCDNCGASVSLLNGGKCTYCGKTLDLSLYEFALEDSKSQWEISGSKGKKNQEKFLKRMIAVVCAVLIGFHIPKICGAVHAGLEGIKQEGYSVYVVGNDIVPSFQNYGYALLGEKTSGFFQTIYTYPYVNDYAGNIHDYADKLVAEDDFRIVDQSADQMQLERHKKFGWGKIKLTILKKDGEYRITIES